MTTTMTNAETPVIARWCCKARFGKKQDVIEKLKHWWSTIGRDIGQSDYTITTGSIGAPESLVTVDVRVRDLAELNEQWDKLGKKPEHKDFARELEPLIVNGSTRWEVLRTVN